MAAAIRRALLGWVVVCTAAAACGGDKTTEPTATVAGTWSLKTVDGVGLPFLIAQIGADRAEVLSDVYVISTAGSFTETTTFRLTQNGVVTTELGEDAGTYTVTGTAVALRFNSDGGTATASWTGNTLTTNNGTLVLVYER